MGPGRPLRLLLLLLLFAMPPAGALTLPDGRGLDLLPFQPRRLAIGLPPQRLWREVAPKDYAYDLERRCYCIGPRRARVFVLGGRVAAVQDLDGGTLLTAPGAIRDFHSIDGLFTLLDRLWASHPARFCVRHQPRWGYPESVEVDPAFNVADDEFSLRITGLHSVAVTLP